MLTAPTDTETAIFGDPSPVPGLWLPNFQTVYHGMGMGTAAYHPGLLLGLGAGYRVNRFVEVTLSGRYTLFTLDEAAVVSHYEQRNQGVVPVEVSVEGGDYTILAALAGLKATSPPVGRFSFYVAARGGIYRHTAAPYALTLTFVFPDSPQPTRPSLSLSERKQTEMAAGMEVGIGLSVALGPVLHLFVEPAYAFSSTDGWGVASVPVQVGVAYGWR